MRGKSGSKFFLLPLECIMSTSLREYAVQYCQMVDGSLGYSRQLIWTVGFLEKFVGRSLAVTELRDAMIRDYVLANREKLRPQTLRSRRNMLWRLAERAAIDPSLDQKPEFPRRQLLPKIKVAAPLVDAWSVAEVRRLVAAADQTPGEWSGGTLASYWASYVRAAWDSGLRGCDLRSLEYQWINPEGRLAIQQKKTSRVVYAAFRPSTLDAIKDCWRDDRRLVWPLYCCLSEWRKTAAELVERAGLKGSIGKLRHSAGTSCEILHPGHGHHFLGNSQAVFDRHYFARQMAAGLWWPEEL